MLHRVLRCDPSALDELLNKAREQEEKFHNEHEKKENNSDKEPKVNGLDFLTELLDSIDSFFPEGYSAKDGRESVKKECKCHCSEENKETPSNKVAKYNDLSYKYTMINPCKLVYLQNLNQKEQFFSDAATLPYFKEDEFEDWLKDVYFVYPNKSISSKSAFEYYQEYKTTAKKAEQISELKSEIEKLLEVVSSKKEELEQLLKEDSKATSSDNEPKNKKNKDK